MTPRTLQLEPYDDQKRRLPRTGRHLLAHHDAHTVVVYQAYSPEIGRYASEHRRLDGPAFKLTRMSWIKPSFLWMMFRSGWATKENQEVVLALHCRRELFDDILGRSVPSKFLPGLYEDSVAWERAAGSSDVRLQWDPDHGPSGPPIDRRAIQLGLRGGTLRRFASELVDVEDITPFVHEQAEVARSRGGQLLVPMETTYEVTPATAARLGLS